MKRPTEIFSLDERFDPQAKQGALQVFAQSKDDVAELHINGPIGEFMDWASGEAVGISGGQVKSFLKDNKSKPVNVHINSDGGLAYEGFVIYNALLSHESKVTAIIDGLAFSAASFIPMAADEIVMYEASHIGIHRAWGMAIGNANEMRAQAEWLDKMDDTLVAIYAARTGQSDDAVNKALDGKDDGTLYNAQDAVDFGLADRIIETKKKQRQSSNSVRHFDEDIKARLAMRLKRWA